MSKSINTTKPVPIAEYQQIVKVVQDHYIEGLRIGDWNTISGAFHKEATMYGWTAIDGPLLGGPISNLKGYLDQYGPAPNMKSRIDIIGITPTSAVVKVDLENDAGGFDYTDFHTLLRMDGKWEIISKVFHKYD